MNKRDLISGLKKIQNNLVHCNKEVCRKGIKNFPTQRILFVAGTLSHLAMLHDSKEFQHDAIILEDFMKDGGNGKNSIVIFSNESLRMLLSYAKDFDVLKNPMLKDLDEVLRHATQMNTANLLEGTENQGGFWNFIVAHEHDYFGQKGTGNLRFVFHTDSLKAIIDELFICVVEYNPQKPLPLRLFMKKVIEYMDAQSTLHSNGSMILFSSKDDYPKKPDGKDVHLFGTAQSVLSNFLELNPGWQLHLDHKVIEELLLHYAETSPLARALSWYYQQNQHAGHTQTLLDRDSVNKKIIFNGSGGSFVKTHQDLETGTTTIYAPIGTAHHLLLNVSCMPIYFHPSAIRFLFTTLLQNDD